MSRISQIRVVSRYKLLLTIVVSVALDKLPDNILRLLRLGRSIFSEDFLFALLPMLVLSPSVSCFVLNLS